VVFPEADLKIYLTASAYERAQRRFKELQDKQMDVKLSHLLEEIQARDARDANRSVAPLRPADDAVIIDTTALDINQALAVIKKMVPTALMGR
jgi:cytidylate kinase